MFRCGLLHMKLALCLGSSYSSHGPQNNPPHPNSLPLPSALAQDHHTFYLIALTLPQKSSSCLPWHALPLVLPHGPVIVPWDVFLLGCRCYLLVVRHLQRHSSAWHKCKFTKYLWLQLWFSTVHSPLAEVLTEQWNEQWRRCRREEKYRCHRVLG